MLLRIDLVRQRFPINPSIKPFLLRGLVVFTLRQLVDSSMKTILEPQQNVVSNAVGARTKYGLVL